jgi:hypothetical protein
MRAAFFKGVWLWEVCERVDGWAKRGGSMEHEGVRQRNKLANPQSPNFDREVKVPCSIELRDEDSVASYELGTAITNTLLDVEDRLRDVAGSAGDLTYCEDKDRVAAVAGAESAGSNVVVDIGTPGGGWVPAAGQLVLFRNPTTNAGFHSVIGAVGGSSITCDLEQDLSSAWEVLRVDRVFPECVYQTMDGGEPRDESDPERDRKEVTYTFDCFGDPVVPSASLLAHT